MILLIEYFLKLNFTRLWDLIELTNGFEVDTNGEFFADVIGGCDEGY